MVLIINSVNDQRAAPDQSATRALCQAFKWMAFEKRQFRRPSAPPSSEFDEWPRPLEARDATPQLCARAPLSLGRWRLFVCLSVRARENITGRTTGSEASQVESGHSMSGFRPRIAIGTHGDATGETPFAYPWKPRN